MISAWALVILWSRRTKKITHNCKTEGKWNITADVMVDNFKDNGHTVIRATSALHRGFSKKKGGRCTIHFSAESSNAELLFRTSHLPNQLSTHGTVANWCDELTQQIPGQTHLSMEESIAKVNDQLSQKLEPQVVDSLAQTPRTNVHAPGDRLRIHHQRFEELSNVAVVMTVGSF